MKARTTNKKLQNKKMNKAVYKERRKVMDCVYSAKALLKRHGFELPRIEVRITHNSTTRPSLIGLASVSKCVIWIPERTLDEAVLYETVLHEIVHAALGFLHDDNCPLMSRTAYFNHPLTKTEADRLFLSYWQNPRANNGVL